MYIKEYVHSPQRAAVHAKDEKEVAVHKVHVFVPHHAGNIVQHSPHGGRKALRGNMVEIYQPRQRPTLTGAVLKATFETAVILLQVANVTLRTAQKLSSTEFRELAQ